MPTQTTASPNGRAIRRLRVLKNRLVITASIAACMGLAAPNAGKKVEIDQNLAGLRIGAPLSKARRLYPSLKADGMGEAKGDGWIAEVGGCALTVSSDRKTRDNGAIEFIAVGRHEDKPLGACAALGTGGGLHMGDGLSRVKELFGTGVPSGAKLLFQVNDAENCMAGRTDFLKEVMVFWSTKGYIQSIIVSGSRGDCSTYRAETADIEGQRKGREKVGSHEDTPKPH